MKGGNTSVTQTTPNELNQISALSYSVNGAPATTSGFDYDRAGNTTLIENADGSKTVFTYDDADRLVRIERKSAANAWLGKSEFIYDYASRKAVSREFTYTAGAWVKTGEKRRVFDGLDVVQERNAANEVTAQLVRDGNIGGILARSTQAGKTFFGYDGGGNVTLLTDENGEDVGRYRYDAFGNTLEASGSRAGENPYRFSTKELHAQSGLYDFGYRFYSPGLGRWINRDPIQESGGVNLYAMVGNNTANRIDLYGLAPASAVPIPQPLATPPPYRPTPPAPYDPGATAQFGTRPFISWAPLTSGSAQASNLAVGHEQLFFGDGRSPSSTGFEKVSGWVGLSRGRQYPAQQAPASGFMFNTEHYNAALMRKAAAEVGYDYNYSLLGNNCQTWADRVRDEYRKMGGKVTYKQSSFRGYSPPTFSQYLADKFSPVLPKPCQIEGLYR